MSLSKRILFGDDPEFEPARAELAGHGKALRAEFTYRLQGRKRWKGPGPQYWDPFWGGALQAAIRELDLASRNINEGVFFQSEQDLRAAKARAEAISGEWRREHLLRLEK